MAISGKITIDLNRRTAGYGRLLWNKATPTRWARTVSGQVAEFAKSGPVAITVRKDHLSAKVGEREVPIFRSHAYANSLFRAGSTELSLPVGLNSRNIMAILDILICKRTQVIRKTLMDHSIDVELKKLETKQDELSQRSNLSMPISSESLLSSDLLLNKGYQFGKYVILGGLTGGIVGFVPFFLAHLFVGLMDNLNLTFPFYRNEWAWEGYTRYTTLGGLILGIIFGGMAYSHRNDVPPDSGSDNNPYDVGSGQSGNEGVRRST